LNYTVASIIERITETLKRKGSKIIADSKTKFSKLVNIFVYVHKALSKEDKVIDIAKAIAITLQKIQGSLEDSLSTQSLFLELLSVLAIVTVLVVAWWS